VAVKRGTVPGGDVQPPGLRERVLVDAKLRAPGLGDEPVEVAEVADGASGTDEVKRLLGRLEVSAQAADDALGRERCGEAGRGRFGAGHLIS
jgi:hypothetical protein